MFQRPVLNDNFSWYHSGQINAPQMSGSTDSNGQLLQVLDAVLCDGFNIQTPIDIQLDNNQIRLSFGTSHGFLKRSLVHINGANDTKLNGKHRVIDVIDNDIVISVENVSNVSGDITVKVAPLDWENMFGKDDKLRRAYRSKNPKSTKTVLYLDMSYPADHGNDTGNLAKRAMVSLCEDMKILGRQINSYTDEHNDFANSPNGSLFWFQNRSLYNSPTSGDPSPRKWVLIGTQDYFIFFVNWVDEYWANKELLECFGFGDFVAPETDKYNVFLFAKNAKNNHGYLEPARSYNFKPFVIRNFDGTGGLQDCKTTLIEHREFGRTGYNFPQPNGIGVVTQQVQIIQHELFRGFIPRLNLIFNNMPNDASFIMLEDMLLIKTAIDPNDFSYLAIYLGD